MKDTFARTCCFFLLTACFMTGLNLDTFGQGSFGGTNGYLQIGPSFLQLPEMNHFLTSENYPLMSERPVSVELGFSKFINSLIIGGNLANFMTAQSRFPTSQIAIASLNYHYLNLFAGMVVLRKKMEYALYPTVGIAGGAALFKYQPLGTRYPESYWSGGLFVNPALTFSRFTLMPDNSKYRLHWGITAGYVYPLDQLGKSWQIRGLAADSVIPVRPEGFYVRLIFGMSKLGKRY